MPQGWYGLICCICFEGLTQEECYKDNDGQAWDLHIHCAEQGRPVE